MADPMRPTSPVSEAVATTRALAVKVDALTREITRLADEQAAQRTSLGRSRWAIALTVALVLSMGGVAVLAYGQVTSRADLDRVASEQEAQRAEAMCPLLGLSLGSYNPDSVGEGPARERYEEAFRVLRDIYSRVLLCENAPVP